MNLSKKLTAIAPLLPRFANEITSPDPHQTSNPSIYQASLDEKREIRALTQDLRATLHDMETVLVVMQEAVEFVQTQQGIYAKSLETHIPLLVPINDLPFEVLSRIFVDVHDLDLDEFHSGLISRRTTNHSKEEAYCPIASAITVAQINHRWSQVALRTPSLWSTLVFSADFEFEEQLISASKWLKRSEGSSLTCVILDFQVGADSERKQHHKSLTTWLREPSLIPLLLPHLSRTRTLRIFGDYFPFLCRLRDENAALSSLEILQLNDVVSYYTSNHEKSQKLLGLEAGPLKSFISSPSINLDHFIFDGRSLQSFKGKLSNKHRLHQLPSLRRCRVEIVKHHEDIPTPLTSHLLTTLWIEIDYPSRDKVLGQLGHFPHLQSLVFYDPIYQCSCCNNDRPGLVAFLQTSGHSLRYLSVYMEEYAAPELLSELLGFTPKLERLDCNVEELCLERFCEILAEGNLPPRLCDLYLSTVGGDIQEWAPPTENGPPLATRSLFNIKICVDKDFANEPQSRRQWEGAIKSMAEYYLPGCETGFLWGVSPEDVMFHGQRPCADIDGLEELY